MSAHKCNPSTPAVFLAGRPTAERAPDAGAIGVEALILLRVAIQNHGLVMREGSYRPTARAEKRFRDSRRLLEEELDFIGTDNRTVPVQNKGVSVPFDFSFSSRAASTRSALSMMLYRSNTLHVLCQNSNTLLEIPALVGHDSGMIASKRARRTVHSDHLEAVTLHAQLPY